MSLASHMIWIIVAAKRGTPHFRWLSRIPALGNGIFVHVPPKKAWDCPEIGDQRWQVQAGK